MTTPTAPAALIAAMALLAALLLALPGQTVTGAFTNDLLIFLDGAHRVVEGQVPNRDFHTALGPLTYYIPGAGLALTGSLGAAMPVGMALLILAFLPLLLHVTGSRLRPVLAVPFAGFLILLLAMPANVGDRIDALSFAMFYNRIGWAALALLMVMHLTPARPHLWRDAACAAALVLLQLYTKATYGLVAVAFLGLMLLDARQRGWAVLALLLTAGSVALVELVWGGSAGHLRDLRLTAAVSGASPMAGLLRSALVNLPTILLFTLCAALALWHRMALRDLLFFGFCLAAGLMILTQNAHGWGIVTLHAGAVVAAERAMGGGAPRALAPGLPLLALAIQLPTTLHQGATLGLHATLAVAGVGQPLGLPEMQGIRYARLWSAGDNGFSQAYLDSLARGAQTLAGLHEPPGRVAVLDFANPFSAGLKLPPARGDWSWLHWGRNVNAQNHPPAPQLLAGAEIVMLPKLGINPGPLAGLYGDYVARHYRTVAETDLWSVHRRSGAGEGS